MSGRLVYYFGNGEADGSARDRDRLGGKGANLAEMTRLGLPVPPGFTVTTEACRVFLDRDQLPPGLWRQIRRGMERLEKHTGKAFGGPPVPLLVAVRSGAAVSMPGMMDTILNLGLNPTTTSALAEATGDSRFAYDAYRRFIQMYGEVVRGVPRRSFDALLDRRKRERGVSGDTALEAEDLAMLADEYKDLVERDSGEPFPGDPTVQLCDAVEAVFRSWDNPRAVEYRRRHDIPDDLGTAVNIVGMVYGNLGTGSGTGVAFSRDPSTGRPGIFGEFLPNAQGEDVVAGVRDPVSIEAMNETVPEAYDELVRVADRLERHYRDMQDIEFTVERGRLYLLQTRTGKRSAEAAVRIAVDMADEGRIDRAEAVRRVRPDDIERLLHPTLDPTATPPALVAGLPASPGAAAGRVVFDPDHAAAREDGADPVILVREETSPDDFHGMAAAAAILTARGGMTSHAAVVARGMGTCCVVGAVDLAIDADGERMTAGDRTIEEGEWVTVDGTTGRVYPGRVPTVDPAPPKQFDRIMAWADETRALQVRANADSAEDARTAVRFGAEGIGLCRTEHMLLRPERLPAVREVILAERPDDRQRALDHLLPMQREDVRDIFRVMDGRPVTIRLLDPPLHEFLPQSRDEIDRTAARLGIDRESLVRRLERHRESNPMLGHRGVRLGISHPEITRMQIRAIFEAAVMVVGEGAAVRPEIMIPFVSDVREFRSQSRLVRRTAREVLDAAGVDIPYPVGTMIELPRAALTAAAIAEDADFFSFGTNDLTQTTYGISRDDAATFLPGYLEDSIFDRDPFRSLDRDGVGRLIDIATREGRAARPTLTIGICGEHGGDPRSIEFVHDIGLDYVSCSPFRIPAARLAAALASLRDRSTEPTEATTMAAPDTTEPIATISQAAD